MQMLNPGFQVSLDVRGRSCVVIGGDDEEVVDKVQRLLNAEAKVTIVNPTLHVTLRKLAASGKIIHRGRRFRSGDTQGAMLILNVIPKDRDLAKSLFEQAKEERFLIWSMDQPEFSTLMMPALVTRGHLRMAISTSGASPALASVLRQHSEMLLGDDCEPYLEWLAALREDLRKTEPSEVKRRERLKEAVEGFRLKGEIDYPQAWLEEKNKRTA